jgi:hypothetical protein
LRRLLAQMELEKTWMITRDENVTESKKEREKVKKKNKREKEQSERDLGCNTSICHPKPQS